MTSKKDLKFIIKKLPIEYIKTTENKFSHLFKIKYFRTFILGKSGSGKSLLLVNLINILLKKGKDRKTTLIVFASKLNYDPIYQWLTDFCNEYDIPMIKYISIMDDGNDMLESTLNDLDEMTDSSEDDIDGEYIFILDDQSKLLRRPSVGRLLKSHRHYKSKVFILSQNLNDLHPESIQQLNYMIIFGHIPELKLAEIYQKLSLNIGFDRFLDIYNGHTRLPFSFLYIDIDNEKFKKDMITYI